MKTIDARDYAPNDKHVKIFEMFFSLQPNESMLLVNDHDPKPLYYQFVMEYPDAFTWDYQTKREDLYEVIIKRLK